MMNSESKSVVFASYRCNCTILARTFAEIPSRCPEHDMEMLDRPSWEENTYNVPLGMNKSENVQEELREAEKVESKQVKKTGRPNLLVD